MRCLLLASRAKFATSVRAEALMDVMSRQDSPDLREGPIILDMSGYEAGCEACPGYRMAVARTALPRQARWL